MRTTTTLALILASTLAACGGDDGGNVSAIDARRIDGAGGPDAAAACPIESSFSTGAGMLNLNRRTSTMNPAVYSLSLGALLGMDMPPDAMFLELYNTYAPFGTSAAPGAIGPGSHTIDATQASYETCGLCLQFHANFDEASGAGSNIYMPNGGTINITAMDPAVGGAYALTFTNLTLREVTIDPMTFVTTDVAGGCTATLTDGSLAGMIQNPPMMKAAGTAVNARTKN